MADPIDLQFALGMQHRLQHFKIKKTNPYQCCFRCPLCGDSEKSSVKTRGWFYEMPDGHILMKCYNCGRALSLGNFLKDQDQLAYKSYVMAKFESRGGKKKKAKVDAEQFKPKKKKLEQIKKIDSRLASLRRFIDLPHDHPVVEYVLSRKIPRSRWKDIYYTPKFNKWANSIIPGKLNEKRDEPRLVLPFIDAEDHLFGCAARGFDPEGLRYISLIFDDSKPKIFGLNTVDFTKPYLVVEGAIDSFFLSNAVAIAGADTSFHGLENLENATFVFDAEPRNKQIVSFMSQVIKAKHKICIWPENVPGKDINLMILRGWSRPKIAEVIKENTFQGMSAELKLAEWKKV